MVAITLTYKTNKMGADVHFYVEYTYKDKLEVYNKAIENGEKPIRNASKSC